MAWDFSTDPEFERKLEWMRGFVREEVWPIEAVEDRLTQADLDRINAPLQAEVRQQGLWAAHLPPDLGGQGFGQVKLGLMNEILGHVDLRAAGLRLPGARLGQQRDPRARRQRRAEGALAGADARPGRSVRRSR